MKLTEAPPSTQSISTSLKAAMSRLRSFCSERISTLSFTLLPRGPRPLAAEHHEITRRTARPIAKRGRLIELHGEAVVLRQPIGHTTDTDLELALLHPDLLMNAHLARPGLIGDSCTARKEHFDDLNRRGKIRRRDVAPDVAGLRVAPTASLC